MTSELVLIAVILVLIAAAVQDLAVLRIWNLYPVLVMLIFVVWVLTRGWESDLWMNFASFAGTLAIGTMLFSLGWLGGGDVKLLAALALWFDWPGIVWLIAMTAIAGGVVAVALYGFRRMVPTNVRRRSSLAILAPNAPIPYGMAIAMGGSLALLSPGPNPALHNRAPTAPWFMQSYPYKPLPAPALLPGRGVNN